MKEYSGPLQDEPVEVKGKNVFLPCGYVLLGAADVKESGDFYLVNSSVNPGKIWYPIAYPGRRVGREDIICRRANVANQVVIEYGS